MASTDKTPRLEEEIAWHRKLLRADIAAGNSDAAEQELAMVRQLEQKLEKPKCRGCEDSRLLHTCGAWNDRDPCG